jgi:6-phosphogluconate dehydrogenase
VDATIELLSALLSPGDILIDGGNEWWENTEVRAARLAASGLLYLGVGVSGGESGARHGPSLMPGGPRAGFDRVAPVLAQIAAQVDGRPCLTYLGPGGAGNYVKMVHNGIEYADMQLIAEVYDLLRTVGGLTNNEAADVFEAWNGGELRSYLVEITAAILRVPDRDGDSGGALVDVVLDRTGMKGTGTWTVRDAALMGVPVPTIAAALTARQLSALHAERQRAAALFGDPTDKRVAGDADGSSSGGASGGSSGGASGGSIGGSSGGSMSRDALCSALRHALYASKIICYAQGYALLRAKSDERGWELPLAEIARIWKGGCIIRASLLTAIEEAYMAAPDLGNLLLTAPLGGAVKASLPHLRAVCALAVNAGVSSPALLSALSYIDQYRRRRLPANLTQAQRDFFGAHTFERTDKPGVFHSTWQ